MLACGLVEADFSRMKQEVNEAQSRYFQLWVALGRCYVTEASNATQGGRASQWYSQPETGNKTTLALACAKTSPPRLRGGD